MKIKKAWFILPLALFISLSVYAAEFKMGFVNTERIYREAAPSIAIQKRLNTEFSERRDELKKLEKQAKDLEEKLKQPDLKAEDRKQLENALSALGRDYQAKAHELSLDFNQRRNEEFAAIQERANRVIRSIAEREHYDLILQDAVYVDPKYDLTPKVLAELNR